MTVHETPRERARAQLEADILRLATDQLVEGGPGALSLRGIARELGIVSSAIYRYCPSREALLTRLIIRAYTDLGMAAIEAEAVVPRSDYRGRLRATVLAVRGWAIANPQRYALIYGTPVPGYRAPQGTIAPASMVGVTLAAIAAELYANGKRSKLTPAMRSAAPGLQAVTAGLGLDIPADILVVGVDAWIHLFGAVSFELYGQFHNVITEPEIYYEFLVDELATRLGAP
ncbi:MAG: TetR/AcrR family transcriptional regulator [Lacisediminihabitans sp.]